MKEYYDRRAPEYDEVWLGAAHQLPGWEDVVGQLCAALSALSPAPTLDVACGTGFLTRVLPGDVTGLDQSPAMLRIAGERVPEARFVQGDGLDLPFADGSFERVFTSFSTATSTPMSDPASSPRHAGSLLSSSSPTLRSTRGSSPRRSKSAP